MFQLKFVVRVCAYHMNHDNAHHRKFVLGKPPFAHHEYSVLRKKCSVLSKNAHHIAHHVDFNHSTVVGVLR